MNDATESVNVTNGLQDDLQNQTTLPDFPENEATDDLNESGELEEAAQNKPTTEDPSGVDYEALAKEDLDQLKEEFPELSALSSITELDNPVRYGALRDLGLTPTEAYLATKRSARVDNRSHLRQTKSVARGAAPLMTEAEMNTARELFSEISDTEIRQLYKKVTK